MHSRIFTLTHDLKPSAETIDPADYDDRPTTADYTRPISREEWKQDLAWLTNVYPWIKSSEEDGAFYLEFDRSGVEGFLKDKFDRLKEFVSEMTFDEFVYDGHWTIRNMLDDEFGFWIEEFDDGCASGCETFDSWVNSLYRWRMKGEKEIKFQVVGITDYHA